MFAWQIDPCLSAQPQMSGIFVYAVDAKIFSQIVEKHVARLNNGPVDCDTAVAAPFPTPEETSVKGAPAPALVRGGFIDGAGFQTGAATRGQETDSPRRSKKGSRSG